ncbi:MAG: type II and III secretion system protein family protein [Alphaproteobacteria bacterium]|nr:MAG: type II and III secretion system protein family protein [Alphaproteobacteria bacterium]
MKRLAISLVLAWGLLAAIPATAVAEDAPKILSIGVDKGTLIRVPLPATSVFTANPKVADVQVLSPQRVMVFGLKPGETTVVVTGKNHQVQANYRVIVSREPENLRADLDKLPQGKDLEGEYLPDGLLIKGRVPTATEAENVRAHADRFVPLNERGQRGKMINRVTVDNVRRQVNLRVRVAEVSRNINKRFGINWETLTTFGSFNLRFATGIAPLLVGESGLAALNRPNNEGGLGLRYTNNRGTRDINTLVDALAEEGLVTMLAEPNLTSMSGETASFLAGGEFPIVVPQSNGTFGIEFRQYGVSLAFTPTILDDKLINLHVRPEVSQLSDTGSVKLNNIIVPGLVTRRAETTIEVGSGQSFAIGGLLQRDVTQDNSKYPFLGDLPVLGGLFRSNNFQSGESELVIIVTPYIVKPVSDPTSPIAPTDNLHTPPDDFSRVLLGNLATSRREEEGAALAGPPAKLNGPVGFVLD